MKNYNIQPLDHTRLDHTNFAQLTVESSAAIAKFAKSERIALYQEKSMLLESLVAEYDGSLNKARASKVAAQLDEADEERDAALVTLTSLVKAFARVKVSETAQAYEVLNDLLKNYKNAASETYEKETEKINHLLKELAKDDYTQALEALHLNPHVEALKQAQATFEEVYAARLQEQKGKKVGARKALREQIQEHYEFLVDFTAINAYAYPENQAYVTLRDDLNAIRARYKKRRSAKKVEE